MKENFGSQFKYYTQQSGTITFWTLFFSNLNFAINLAFKVK